MDLIVRAPENAKPGLIPIDWITGLTDLLSFTSNSRAATIQVGISGTPVNCEWSEDDELPGPGLSAFDDDTTLPTRTIDFTLGFTVNDAAYDGTMAQRMRLGTAEEWTITNSTGGVHAFHIHLNPFFVTHINGMELPQDSPLRRWQDTIALPYSEGGKPGSITYKTRFESFTGKFVIHCHVLRHEDLGMMQTVEVY